MRYPLSNGKYVLIDAEDLDLVKDFNWYGGPYAYHQENNKTIYMHRIIMNSPEGMEVDHINGDTLDNRKANLRVVTHRENIRNSKTQVNNLLGFKGVCLEKGKPRKNPYRAKIYVDGKLISLGYYATLEEAVEARRQGEIKYWGKECLR